jgi:2-methylcitrate dehydratase PrpD
MPPSTVQLALSKQGPVDDVAEIVCLVHPWNRMTLREETPRDPLQAKVNMKFCVAAALSRRRLTHDDFTPAALDPEIMRLMDRIRVSISDDLPDIGEFPAEVRITLSDGSAKAERRDVPRGGSTEPGQRCRGRCKARLSARQWRMLAALAHSRIIESWAARLAASQY